MASSPLDPVRSFGPYFTEEPDFLEVFQDVCEEVGAAKVGPFAEFLRGILLRETSMDRMPQNGGALLVVATAAGFGGRNQAIEDLSLSELVIAGTAASMKLRRVNIGQLKAQSADLSQVVFDECTVHTLVADETTRFGTSKPQVIVVHDPSEQHPTLRSPAEVSSWLDRHSMQIAMGKTASVARDVQLPLARLFDRICRKALRQFYIREGDEDPGGVLLSDPLWPILREILEAEGRLERSTKAMGGPPSELIHIKNPRALLEPPPSDESSLRTRQAVLTRAQQNK